MAKEKNVFNNEKSHYINIQSIFDSSDSGRYNDVEFSLSDGSKLKANKCILASQSEYFDTMFYGSLKHDGTVPLQWCSKTSMGKVLAFLSVGKVDIGDDLDIMELLELLEAARLMCLENLFNFIEAYVKHFVDSSSDEKMPPVQALTALDFALVKHFESITTWLLQFIDRNIKDFMKMRPEEAGVLSANGMIILLVFKGAAKRIDFLTFFIVWKEAGQDSGIEIAQYVKLEELNAQELRIARASNLYSLSEITDYLDSIVSDYETTMKETSAKVENQNLMIIEKNVSILNHLNEIKEKSDVIQEKNSEIENLKQDLYEQESEVARVECYNCSRYGMNSPYSCFNRRHCNKCNNCKNNFKNDCLARIHGL